MLIKWQAQRLLVPFFIYCTAMGAVAVPKINVILALMCVQYSEKDSPISTQQQLGSDQICHDPVIHARMARFMIYANLISGIGCAISSPKIGALSDRYGRKPLLAFTALGLLFADVISITAGWFPHRLSVYWVLLEFGFGGLTGSFGASMALVQTYAADCCEEDQRVFIFSRLHACNFLGVALGPAAGTLFIRYIGRGDMLSVLYGASICHAAFIAFVLFGIPESLPKPVRLPSDPESTAPTVKKPAFPETILSKLCAGLRHANLLRPLLVLVPSSDVASSAARRYLPLLASMDAIGFGVQIGLTSILILYSEYRLGWENMTASIFVSITNATRAIILSFLLPLVFQYARKQSRTPSMANGRLAKDPSATHVRSSLWAVRIAILFESISSVGFAVSSGPVIFTMSGVIAAAAAPMSPVIQSLMTTYVEPERVGELLGAVTLLHALARSFVPAGLQLVYSLTLRDTPGTVFWIMGGLFAIMFALSLYVRL
jgi:MFS family permease